MKVDKPFIDAMREATRLMRTQGPAVATRFIQTLLRSPRAPEHQHATEHSPSAAPAPSPSDARLQTEEHPAGETFEHIPPHPSPVEAGAAAELRPASGQFLNKRYAGPEGARNFKLYVPTSYAGTPLPMLVMLHGCTQGADDFALGTRANRWAENRNFLVAYPEQIQRANAHRCWNWFRSGDQSAGRGEPEIIAGITRQICSEYQIDARRVYVAGLSAGGAMAAVMGHAYPELFAAIGVHSGLPVGAAHDVASAFALMKTGHAGPALGSMFQAGGGGATHAKRFAPLIVFHGDDDQTVNPANAKRLVDDAIEVQRRLNPAALLQSHSQILAATADSNGYRRTEYAPSGGQSIIEQWEIRGGGHAWSGGDVQGSYADARGPDATAAMFEFFARHIMPELRDAPPIVDAPNPS